MKKEDAIQQSCYNYFWNTYPKLRKLLFAVPNGGSRTPVEAIIFKATGVVSGVSDMILLYDNTPYCFELKTDVGTQSKNQKDWEDIVKGQGIYYKLIRSKEQFVIELDRIIDDKYKFKRV